MRPRKLVRGTTAPMARTSLSELCKCVALGGGLLKMCDTEVVKYIIAETPNQNSIRSYRRPLKASAQAVGTSPDSMSGVNTENMMELMTSEHSKCCRTTICRFLLHSMAQGGRGGDLQEASL